MKELQKYYVRPVDLSRSRYSDWEKEIYLASEADAAFAEMRRQNNEAIELCNQDVRNYQRICDNLRRDHAEEIERLRAERDARPYTNNDELNLAIRRLREWGQCLSDKLESQPADWEQDSSLETWFPFTAEEIVRLRRQAERYEKLRRLNVGQFQDLFIANIAGKGRFDALVDQLPASGEASEEEHGEKPDAMAESIRRQIGEHR